MKQKKEERAGETTGKCEQYGLPGNDPEKYSRIAKRQAKGD
jgi:hypothetical protein